MPRPKRILSVLTAVAVAAAVPAATTLILVVVAGGEPGTASADGDPASDVLLGENVFYPYTPPVSNGIQNALNAKAAAASRAGLPIKIALIGSPVDLGTVPDLFGKPQQYADFLDQEISFQAKQPLLVVMAAGYGVQGMSPQAGAAVASLAKPAGGQPNDLAQAAITAVPAVARATGHPLSGSSGSANGSPGSTQALLVAILALAAIATTVALLVLRRRQATGR